MGISFSANWQALVNAHVTRYTGTLRQLTKEKVGWDFVTEVLEIYIAAAEKAMGSISARGGYPEISFTGGESPEKWAPLSIFTVAAKNGLDTEDISQDVLKAAWDSYVDSTKIWEDSGSTKGSLSIDENNGTVTANDYAQLVEEGGTGSWGKPVPARPLFSVLNEAFLDYIRNEIRNKRSTLYKNIRREVKAKGLWK